MDSRTVSSPRGRPLVGAVLWTLAGLGATGPVLATTTVTQFAYDAGDHVVKVTDPRNLVTTYAYDALGQLWQQTSPDTGTTSWAYDAYGRPITMTRADNVQTAYGYDKLNRTINITAGGKTQTFSYDACTNGVGRLCAAADATGTTSYSYSPEGWITGRGFSISGTTYALGYGYNEQGQVVSVVYPDGNQAIYTYTRGVVSGVTLNVGGTEVTGASGITYEPMSAGMSGWTSSNGIVNSFTYDTDGRLTGINAAGVQSLAFNYDEADRNVGVTDNVDGAMSQNFGYDAESRLRSVYSDADNQAFQYDPNGNRLTQARNGVNTTYTINPNSNQLTGTSGEITAGFGYTPQGNITTVNGNAAYIYSPFNRINVAGTLTEYVNPEGQRLAKSGGSTGTTYFAPDTAGGLLAENHNGAWIDYVWLNGRTIARIAIGQVYGLHDDQTGRPEAVTDANRATVWRAQNFAFDRRVVQDVIGGLNLGFPGQYYDAETLTWNNGFRDYSPQLGRYLESDPLGLSGGINTYAYVNGNPITMVDVYGLAGQYSFGVSLTVITPWVGVSMNLGGGVSFDGWNSRGFDQAQFAISKSGESHGFFFGVGPGAGLSRGPTPTTGTSSSPYIEGDVAYILGLGTSATKDDCGNIAWSLSRGIKASPGAGAGGFAGTSYSAVLAGPTLGTLLGHH